jgi:hypothetical protein
MGRLIYRSDSGGRESVVRCLQRVIALTAIGIAALAVWSGPAAAADPVSLAASAPSPSEIDNATPVAAAAAPESPESPAAAAPTSDVAPAPPPEVPAVPDVAAPAVPDPVSVESSNPVAPIAADSGHEVEHMTAAIPAVQTPKPPAPKTPAIAPTSIASTITHTVPEHSSQIGVNGPADPIADVTAAPGHISAPSDAPARPPMTASTDDRDDGVFLPLPRALAPTITVTVHRIAALVDNPGATSPLDLLIGDSSASAASSSGSSSAPETMHGGGSAPGIPGLPAPLQIPLAGSATGNGNSSTGFFLFGFAALLVGLIGPAAPALGRRLQGSPASWRPAPYLSLLELPG